MAVWLELKGVWLRQRVRRTGWDTDIIAVLPVGTRHRGAYRRIGQCSQFLLPSFPRPSHEFMRYARSILYVQHARYVSACRNGS